MKKEKIYKVRKVYRSGSRNSETIFEGSINRLINEVFGYTLLVGNQYDSKVNKSPKTIGSLITNVHRAYEAVNNYNTFIEQVTD